jgi:hypothetical protein
MEDETVIDAIGMDRKNATHSIKIGMGRLINGIGAEKVSVKYHKNMEDDVADWDLRIGIRRAARDSGIKMNKGVGDRERLTNEPSPTDDIDVGTALVLLGIETNHRPEIAPSRETESNRMATNSVIGR